MDSPRGEGIITDAEIVSLLAELQPKRELDRRISRERRYLYCSVIKVLEALYRGVHGPCIFCVELENVMENSKNKQLKRS